MERRNKAIDRVILVSEVLGLRRNKGLPVPMINRARLEAATAPRLDLQEPRVGSAGYDHLRGRIRMVLEIHPALEKGFVAAVVRLRIPQQRRRVVFDLKYNRVSDLGVALLDHHGQAAPHRRAQVDQNGG